MIELSREEVLKIAFSGWCLENQILLELDESEALILFQTAYEAGATAIQKELQAERAVSAQAQADVNHFRTALAVEQRALDKLLEALKVAETVLGGIKYLCLDEYRIVCAAIAEVEAMRKEKPEWVTLWNGCAK